MKRIEILLAVDGSETSGAVVRACGQIASALEARVSIVHVHEVGRSDMSVETPERSALRVLTQLRVQARIEVRAGDPVDEILAACRGRGCDLLVMGSRGRSNLAGMMLGSVSQGVLARATCPVLLVRAGAEILAPFSILLALEGLQGSAALVAITGKMARALDARVTVAHFSYPGAEGLERALYHARKTHGEQVVLAAVEELSRAGVAAEGKSLTAPAGAARAIAAYADQSGADLVILGAHPPADEVEDAGIEQAVSVAHRTKRPVLVSREQDETR